MKNINLKRIAALALVGALAVSTASCSTKPASQAQGTSTPASGSASTPATGEKARISFMTTSFQGKDLKNAGADEVIKLYEEHTNTIVDWQWENNDTYQEKFGLTLMDKNNMPMVITASGNLTANVVDAAKRGAFWDLAPFLADKEAYPNLSQADPNILKALTVNGQVIGIYRWRETGRYGMSYRTDWAEKVGITEAPKTIEDVYNMMWKFTNEDPDGNGKKDTYGLEMTKYTGPLDIMQTWFGVGNEWIEKDGQLVPVHQTEEYREALKWLRKIYDEGLIRKDWATVDSGTFSDGCKKGEAGMFIDVMDGAKRIWNYFVTNDVKSVVDPTKQASMNLVGPVENVTLATSGFNGYYLITKSGAKTEQDVKNVLHFMDKMSDEEMITLADYGLEGVTYDIVDGQIVRRSDIEVTESPSHGLNQCLSYIPKIYEPKYPLKRDEPTIAQDEAYARNKEVAVFNPALGYLANSTVNAEVGTDIKQIIDDARTQYICGQIDDKGLDQLIKQWSERGGDRLVTEINELYKADTSK